MSSNDLLNGILNGPRAIRPRNYECIYMDSKGWLRDDDLFEAPEYLINCLSRAKVGFYVTRNGSVYAEKGGFEKAVKIAQRDYDENLENQR